MQLHTQQQIEAQRTSWGQGCSPTFVVNSLPLQSNSALFWVTPLPLRTFLTGYNNVRIKEGDEWKAAFTMYIGAYEPTVMYFGLTNSPLSFQTMMNDLFQNLINQEDTTTFIDDILVTICKGN